MAFNRLFNCVTLFRECTVLRSFDSLLHSVAVFVNVALTKLFFSFWNIPTV